MADKKLINGEMNIAEVVTKFPETEAVFEELGLACIGCVASEYETLQQGLTAHGIDVAEALEKLNSVVTKK
jgi:hybrid cluster-associated redox disulfide protein